MTTDCTWQHNVLIKWRPPSSVHRTVWCSEVPDCSNTEQHNRPNKHTTWPGHGRADGAFMVKGHVMWVKNGAQFHFTMRQHNQFLHKQQRVLARALCTVVSVYCPCVTKNRERMRKAEMHKVPYKHVASDRYQPSQNSLLVCPRTYVASYMYKHYAHTVTCTCSTCNDHNYTHSQTDVQHIATFAHAHSVYTHIHTHSHMHTCMWILTHKHTHENNMIHTSANTTHTHTLPIAQLEDQLLPSALMTLMWTLTHEYTYIHRRTHSQITVYFSDIFICSSVWVMSGHEWML